MAKRTLLKFTSILAAAAMVTSGFAVTASAAQTVEPSGAVDVTEVSRETYGDFLYSYYGDSVGASASR